ncbi:MAG: rod shape-determining protein MreC, partial [Alistipes sp.]|nr:rod shape-determining protein MreC [Alistipes sp.]
YMTARVVSSSVNKSRNFMVLDRGMADGVKTDMAVVSPRGAMVGYVVGCSDRYSVVLPVLNTSFRASGKLQRGQHFGSIVWDGFDKHAVRLTELSKYAEPQIGDTVVSTGFSHYFPEGVMIGRVTDCRMNGTRTAYDLDLDLAADLSALHRVILIDNRDQDEIRELVSSAAEQYN